MQAGTNLGLSDVKLRQAWARSHAPGIAVVHLASFLPSSNGAHFADDCADKSGVFHEVETLHHLADGGHTVDADRMGRSLDQPIQPVALAAGISAHGTRSHS